MVSTLQIVAGIEDETGQRGIQVVRVDDGEVTILFTCSVDNAYQFFYEGVQICYILKPELELPTN